MLDDCEAALVEGLREFPANGKAFQRIMREMMAEQPDPLLSEKLALAADFKNASVREISSGGRPQCYCCTRISWGRSAVQNLPMACSLGSISLVRCASGVRQARKSELRFAAQNTPKRYFGDTRSVLAFRRSAPDFIRRQDTRRFGGVVLNQRSLSRDDQEGLQRVRRLR